MKALPKGGAFLMIYDEFLIKFRLFENTLN